MKVDFHIHTIHSPDSLNTLWLLNKICVKKGITPVISDHNRIRYAQEYKRRFGNAIVAEEIETAEGEVICLFANERIRAGLSIEETIDRIREQGALVYVPHPFDRMRSSAIKRLDFKPDIIEVFNARVIRKEYNRQALDFAEQNGYLKAAGSDAHLPFEIGKSYAEMEEFSSIKEFMKNLKAARLVTNYQCPLVHPVTKSLYFVRKRFSAKNE